MLANHFVRDRPACHWNTRHVAARSIDCLPHSFGNFVGFACREAYFALAVANCNESVE
jgi:hypothetical protein